MFAVPVTASAEDTSGQVEEFVEKIERKIRKKKGKARRKRNWKRSESGSESRGKNSKTGDCRRAGYEGLICVN